MTLLLLSGCAVTNLAQGDELLRQNRIDEAARAYQRARPADADAIAFRQALIYASPKSPRYDSERAQQVLRSLVLESAGGPYAVAAEIMLGLLEGQRRAGEELAAVREGALACETERAAERTEWQQAREAADHELAQLGAELEKVRGELERQRVDRAELERLRNELSAMKRIDLDP